MSNYLNKYYNVCAIELTGKVNDTQRLQDQEVEEVHQLFFDFTIKMFT